jgi:Amt family ammonium transporter
MGSTIGMLLLGLTASAEVNPAIANTFKVAGAVHPLTGSASQLVNQIIGILVAAAMGGIGTFILLKIINAVIGLRVDQEAESLGLDLAEHGEKAYND